MVGEEGRGGLVILSMIAPWALLVSRAFLSLPIVLNCLDCLTMYLSTPLSNPQEYTRQAADLYMKCGRMQAAADCFARGAKMIEEKHPTKAVKLYRDAINMMEEEGKDSMTGDMYRNGVAATIRAGIYDEVRGAPF
jgi:hypothetical protein